MFFHVATVILLVYIAPSFAFYPGYGVSGRPRVCPLPSKPCRMKASMAEFYGLPVGEMESQSCTCPYPDTCSNDWSDEARVISRTLFSTTYNITLSMMFCRPVQPQRFCGVNEEALVVSGPLAIPQNIVSFNCRCESGTPLLLHQRSVREDHLTYSTYVCEYHKATCPYRVSPCLTMEENVANYNCKCPRGLFCRSQDFHGQTTHGYCRS